MSLDQLRDRIRRSMTTAKMMPLPVFDTHLRYVDLSLPETDHECTVGFDYSPAEAMTLEYPGCDAEVEISEVWVNGADIAAVLLERVAEQLTARVFERLTEMTEDAKADAAADRAFYSEVDTPSAA